MPKLEKAVDPKTAGDLRTSNTQAMLLSYIERLERLEEERKGIVEDAKEVRAEAKGVGFDTSVITRLIRWRKDPAGNMESDAIFDLYKETVQRAEKAQFEQSQRDAT